MSTKHKAMDTWRYRVQLQVEEKSKLQLYAKRLSKRLLYHSFQKLCVVTQAAAAQRKQAVRVINRIQKLRIFRVFNNWAIAVKNQKRLRTNLRSISSKLMYRRLNAGFRSLLENVRFVNFQIAEKEAEDQKMMRAIMYIKNRLKAKTYKTWHVAVLEIVRQRGLLTKCSMRLKHLKTAMVFGKWKEDTVWKRRMRHKMKIYVKRMKNRRVSKVLRSWQTIVAYEKERRTKLRRFCTIFSHRDFSVTLKAFQKWFEITKLEEHKELTLRRFGTKLVRRKLHIAFNGFQAAVSRTINQRKLVHRALGKVIHRRKAKVLATWCQVVSRKKDIRFALSIIIDKRYRRMIRNALTHIRLVSERLYKERLLIKRVISRYRYRSIGQGFRSWYLTVQSSARAEKKIRHCLNFMRYRMIAKAMTHWHALVARRKQLRSFVIRRLANKKIALLMPAFRTWTTHGVWSDRQERNTRLIGRLIGKARRRAFLGWKLYTKTMKSVMKSASSQGLKNIKYRLVGIKRRSFQKFKNQVMLRIQKKRLLRRIIMHFAHKAEGFCINKWKSFVQFSYVEEEREQIASVGKQFGGLVQRYDLLAQSEQDLINELKVEKKKQEEMKKKMKTVNADLQNQTGKRDNLQNENNALKITLKNEKDQLTKMVHNAKTWQSKYQNVVTLHTQLQDKFSNALKRLRLETEACSRLADENKRLVQSHSTLERKAKDLAEYSLAERDLVGDLAGKLEVSSKHLKKLLRENAYLQSRCDTSTIHQANSMTMADLDMEKEKVYWENPEGESETKSKEKKVLSPLGSMKFIVPPTPSVLKEGDRTAPNDNNDFTILYDRLKSKDDGERRETNELFPSFIEEGMETSFQTARNSVYENQTKRLDDITNAKIAAEDLSTSATVVKMQLKSGEDAMRRSTAVEILRSPEPNPNIVREKRKGGALDLSRRLTGTSLEKAYPDEFAYADAEQYSLVPEAVHIQNSTPSRSESVHKGKISKNVSSVRKIHVSKKSRHGYTMTSTTKKIQRDRRVKDEEDEEAQTIDGVKVSIARSGSVDMEIPVVKTRTTKEKQKPSWKF
eukprot:g3558.t1